MAMVFSSHWYVRPVPLAPTENVTDWPSHAVVLVGLLVMLGAVFTVNAAALESTDP
jgi:hypothetical protein